MAEDSANSQLDDHQKQADDPKKLNEKIIALFYEVIIPKRLEFFVESNSKVDNRILGQAVDSCKNKIKAIIDNIPNLNADSLYFRIPGENFIDMLLQTEYIYFNALMVNRGQ